MKLFKTIIAVWLLIFFCHAAYGATLKWNASTGADGYNIYFTDGTENFNYNAGNALEVPDIDETLNLHPGTTYTFTAKAYNETGESGASNSVDYTTADAYLLLPDKIPVKLSKPTTITITIE